MPTVPLRSIVLGHNFRSKIDPKETARLAGSIAALGLLQPLVVVPLGKTNKYELRAGFRRFAAIESLKWHDVEVTVLDPGAVDVTSAASTHYGDLVNLAENVRIDPTPYDTAVALDKLVNGPTLEDGTRGPSTHTRDEVQSILGLSKPYVNNLLRCIEKLSPSVLAVWKKDPINVTTKLVQEWAPLTHEEQDERLEEFVGGTTADRKRIKKEATESKGKKAKAKGMRTSSEIREAIESLKASSPRRAALEWAMGDRKHYT